MENRHRFPDIPRVNKPSKLPGFVLFLFCFDAILVATYVVDAQMGSPLSKHTSVHDLGAGASFPAWLLSAKYLLAAGMLWFAVRGRFRGGEIRTWPLAVLPMGLAALSLNVFTHFISSMGSGVNELVSRSVQALTHLGTTGTKTLAIGIPSVLIGAGLLYAFARSTFWKSAALWRFALGLTLPVAAALALEALGGFLPREGALRIAFGTYFQMLGATLMLWAAREQALADLAEIVQLAKTPKSTAGTITPDAEEDLKQSA